MLFDQIVSRRNSGKIQVVDASKGWMMGGWHDVG